jgi:PAS domain S-box-containing protein
MVVEAVNAGIYEWRVADQAIYVSPTWKRLLGYREDELKNISMDLYFSIVHPNDLGRINLTIAEHFKNKKPYFNEYRILNKSGEYLWFMDSGYTKFDNKGKPMITVGSIIDINERKLAEEKIIQQNDLLAKANTELDRFVYSVSHDLRAPLSSILGLTNVYTLSAEPSERETIIKLISDRANTLDAFIREILDYSRNSRRTLKLQWVNLRKLVDEVIEELGYMKGFERLRLEVDIDTALEVMTDRDRLKVVLNNLVANSVKYSDYGKDSFIRISSSLDSGRWSLAIEDNGIGIKPEHHERVFDMFYQAHDHSQGSGLGLYIVKETIQRLQGEIQMNSIYGSGTKFFIVMPAHPVVEDSGHVLVEL